MEILLKYFPQLTPLQIEQFSRLKELYTVWNEQINVISRKDIEHLYERHVLHSLSIAKVIQFKDQTSVLDVGTGGGFPGIPLAIFFPQTQFFLCDSIGKKIKVVNEIIQALDLKNIKAEKIRAEEIPQQFDFVVSRAVTRLKPFYHWVKNKFLKGGNNSLPNGILYLKGGILSEELQELQLKTKTFPLEDYFKEEFFETKKIIYISVR